MKRLLAFLLSKKECETINLRKEIETLHLKRIDALQVQQNNLNVKHKAILKSHSDKLKDHYKENFTKMVNFYKLEIDSLNEKLIMERSSRLTSNMKRPVYSTGRYSEEEANDYSTNGARKTVTPDQTEPTCYCELVCICKPANLS